MTAPAVGVDGWKGGWVAVTLEDGRVDVTHHDAFTDVLAGAAPGAVIAVDIPIGLPTRPGREADDAARRVLRPHGSRVFATFPRRVMASETYAEAIRRCGSGPRISRQSYGLRAKVLEVDAYRYDGRLYEVHPELSFATMTGRPLPSKLTWDGVAMRRRALANQGIELPDDIGSAGRVPVADVLDAAAAAWSAARIGSGLALCLPPAPPVQDGRLVAIWV